MPDMRTRTVHQNIDGGSGSGNGRIERLAVDGVAKCSERYVAQKQDVANFDAFQGLE
jgi:hypothetical protein